MKPMITLLLSIAIGFPLVIVATHRAATVHVYGYRIQEEKLAGYLDKYLGDYQANTISKSKTLLVYCKVVDGKLVDKPYIAKSPWDIFTKYHIEGVGTVPWWSPSAKRIEQRFREVDGDFPPKYRSLE